MKKGKDRIVRRRIFSFSFMLKERKEEKARKERVRIQGLDFIKGLSCSGLEKL